MKSPDRHYRLTLRGRLVVALPVSLLVLLFGHDISHTIATLAPLVLGPMLVIALARRWLGRFK